MDLAAGSFTFDFQSFDNQDLTSFFTMIYREGMPPKDWYYPESVILRLPELNLESKLTIRYPCGNQLTRFRSFCGSHSEPENVHCSSTYSLSTAPALFSLEYNCISGSASSLKVVLQAKSVSELLSHDGKIRRHNNFNEYLQAEAY